MSAAVAREATISAYQLSTDTKVEAQVRAVFDAARSSYPLSLTEEGGKTKVVVRPEQRPGLERLHHAEEEIGVKIASEHPALAVHLMGPRPVESDDLINDLRDGSWATPRQLHHRMIGAVIAGSMGTNFVGSIPVAPYRESGIGGREVFGETQQDQFLYGQELRDLARAAVGQFENYFDVEATIAQLESAASKNAPTIIPGRVKIADEPNLISMKAVSLLPGSQAFLLDAGATMVCVDRERDLNQIGAALGESSSQAGRLTNSVKLKFNNKKFVGPTVTYVRAIETTPEMADIVANHFGKGDEGAALEDARTVEIKTDMFVSGKGKQASVAQVFTYGTVGNLSRKYEWPEGAKETKQVVEQLATESARMAFAVKGEAMAKPLSGGLPELGK